MAEIKNIIPHKAICVNGQICVSQWPNAHNDPNPNMSLSSTLQALEIFSLWQLLAEGQLDKAVHGKLNVVITYRLKTTVLNERDRHGQHGISGSMEPTCL